jgi:integrase
VFRIGAGGPWPRNRLMGVFRRAVKDAGLPEGTTSHDLRHHYASLLIAAGCSVKSVQERLGHASAVETLQTYAHRAPDDEDRTRAAVERAWAVPARAAESSLSPGRAQ